MAHHILMVSPIPSHPQDQGNSARIYALGRLLQTAGYVMHFLYYQMEGLTSAQLFDMQACWDFVHPVRCATRDMSPTGPGYYRLDDWDDPLVSETATRLQRRFNFRAVLANYVWFSAVLDVFGSGVIKLLDTHDVFGGRAQRFLAAGLVPEWFYTTAAEEARGLARADIVLAIQDEEAEHFRSLGHADVRVLGHMMGQRNRALESPVCDYVRVGYFASGNPLNVRSFEAVTAGLRDKAIRSTLEFAVAGSICDKLIDDVAPFRILGRVKHVDDFYDHVDLVINPMQMGTGLKIKSVEAVFEGLPLLATTAAMIGLPVTHWLHALDDAKHVAECLVREAFNTALMAELRDASIACASAYVKNVRKAFLDITRLIDGI